MTTHLKPRTATVVLYQGDDLDQLADLQRAVTAAERRARADNAMLGDDPDAGLAEAKSAFDAFVDEAAERALTIKLHSIGRTRFRDLLLAHPPRKVTETVPATPDTPECTREVEHEDDREWGVNTETFPEALLTYAEGNARTIAAPKFASPAACAVFIGDELSDGDAEQLWQAAYFLNRAPSADPKSVRYSMASAKSDET